ncbi:MAG: hypothetical protein ACK52I_30860 [Pseudomonadota bacterium]
MLRSSRGTRSHPTRPADRQAQLRSGVDPEKEAVVLAASRDGQKRGLA